MLQDANTVLKNVDTNRTVNIKYKTVLTSTTKELQKSTRCTAQTLELPHHISRTTPLKPPHSP